MSNIKHYVGNTQVSTIVEVLTEMNAAEKLGLKSDNYTGTSIYNALGLKFNRDKALAVVGATGYYNKKELKQAVSEYIARRSITPEQKRAIADVIRLVKTQPERAERALAILTK